MQEKTAAVKILLNFPPCRCLEHSLSQAGAARSLSCRRPCMVRLPTGLERLEGAPTPEHRLEKDSDKNGIA